jgi:hypothetical protein
MNLLLNLLTVFVAPAVAAAVSWLLLRYSTKSTKYAWALAIAIGYVCGHISINAWESLGTESSGEIGAWASTLPSAFSEIMWPRTALNWLPIGVLLAGLVSVNSAAFGASRTIAYSGAAMVTTFIVSQCLRAAGILDFETLTGLSGIKLVGGVLGLLGCWLSLNHSIQGRSRWAWMGSVSVLTVSVVAVLVLSGNQRLANLVIVVLCAMLGALLVSPFGCGTDNVRWSGAAIAASSIGLLMMGWWVSAMPCYPVAILVVGYLAVSFTPPLPFGTMMTRRIVTSVTCAVAAVAVTALLGTTS